MSFIGELKRRNVIRVGLAFLAGSWLIIQVLETLFPIFGLNEKSIQVVVVILAIGFVAAVILAWVFQVTPGGIVKDSGQGRDADPVSHTGVDRFIIVALVLAVALFAIHTFVIDPSRDLAEKEAAREQGRAEALVDSFGDKSIAVLAFENMSADPEQDFFADGIAEELLNLLSRVEGLRVTSRTSAFAFRDSDASIPEIADELKVNFVLEGSVRRYGDDIRITAQLIDARADLHVWSDTWDRKWEDVFAIQDEVAEQVVDELKIQLSVDMPKVERHDPAAYSLFLQARQLMNSGSDDYESIASMLDRVLEIEPEYVDALVELAWAYSRLGDFAGYENDDELRDEYWRRRDELLELAESIAPDNVSLNVTLGWNDTRNIRAAAQYAERALSKDPKNERALNLAVMVFTRLWREDQAVPIAQYAADLDPLFYAAPWNLGRAQLNSGAFVAAEETFRTVAAIQEDSYRPPWYIGLALLLQGKHDAALTHFRDNVAAEELRLHGLVLALHELGRVDESQAALASLKLVEGRPGFVFGPFLVGTASAWIGNTDDAFQHFEEQRELNSGIFRVEADSPLYRNLREDPRWLPFLRSVELDPEELAAVAFNPRLPAAVR